MVKGALVPLYMDIHHLPAEADAAALAQAHQADLQVQDKYATTYRSYWFDEATHTAFCLVDAPDAASASAVHREAHGLVADEVHEVVEGT
jgi:hypothetical protein